MFLNSINLFRGIAILFIVAGHTYATAGVNFDTFPEKIIASLVTGGTVFFVFISGFLFHHVFYRTFEFKKFITNKIKNVYFPYIILSLIPLIYCVFIIRNGPYREQIFAKGEPGTINNIITMINYLVTGRIFDGYWYISFIMIIFVLSPVFIRYIRLKNIYRIIIMILLLVIPVIMHRPVYNINVIQSVVYFIPVYMFGINCSIKREFLLDKLAGKEFIILTAALTASLAQILILNSFGNFHKEPFTITVPDIMIIQKMILCMFFMVFLNRFENTETSFLNKIYGKLAETSFAIYFIHPFIVDFIGKGIISFPKFRPDLLSWTIYTLLIILVSFIIANAIKLIFRKYSRYITGW